MRFYIDPGTGSMLFTILIGVISAAVFAVRGLFVKLRFYLSGGRQAKADDSRLPFVIFTDSKRDWNLFKPICDIFEKRKQPLTYMTASPDDPALQEDYEYVTCEFIGEGNKAFARLNMLKADILLSSTPGLEVYQWKRSKDVRYYVHIPHAINDSVVIYRMFGVDYYDAILLTGEYQINQVREIERLRKLPQKELVLIGQPHMDELKKQAELHPVSEHEKTVLLAPSWGASAIFSRYGGRIINALLETDYHLIIRPHPQSFTSEKELIEGLMKEYPDSERVEWNRDDDNFEALSKADILISDFSGVIFDFTLVFDKPVIYADTAFDKAPYDACWLEEELWTFTTLPKIGMQLTEGNLDRIEELIDTCLTDPSFRENRDKAREETWVHRGEGAERTADFLIAKHTQLTKKETEKEAEPEEEQKTEQKAEQDA